jgi:adenine/guanine phosphoribosyltransferase-like PRPP-binding protein
VSLSKSLTTDGSPTATFLDPAQRLRELRSDLFAAGYRTAPTSGVSGDAGERGERGEWGQLPDLDPYAFCTRPTVLRGLAAHLAELLTERLDRLVAADSSAVPLTSAVALHTGLPFAVADSTSPIAGTYGEIHRGERVIVIAAVTTSGSGAVAATALVRERGAEVCGVLTAVDRGKGASARVEEAGLDLHVLFPEDSAHH